MSNIIIPLEYDEIKEIKRTKDHFFIVKKGTKKALFNSEGEQVSRFSFETISFLENDFFLVSRKAKFGIINADGKTIIPMKYDNFSLTYGNYYLVRDANKFGLIGEDGTVLISPKLTKEIFYSKYKYSIYASSFKHYEKKTGEIITVNLNGQEIVPALYDTLLINLKHQNFNSYHVHDYYLVQKDSLFGIISNETEMIIPKYESLKIAEFYSDTIVPFQRNGKVGYLKLNDMSEMFYGDYDVCQHFTRDYAIVEKENKYGLINRQGEELLPPIYGRISIQNSSKWNPYIDVDKLSFKSVKDGFLQQSGLFYAKDKRFIVPVEFSTIRCIYDGSIKYYSGYNTITDSTYIFSSQGFGKALFKTIGKPYYVNFQPKTANNKAYFRVVKTSRETDIKYYTVSGQRVLFETIKYAKQSETIPKELSIQIEITTFQILYAKYDALERISGAFYYPTLFGIPPLYIAKKNNMYGIITAEQEIIIPFIYNQIQQTNKGFLRVIKEDKQGWISKTGEVILPIIYDQIRPIKTGPFQQETDSLFHLVKNGKNGIVNRKGEIIIQPIYDELITDFNGVKFQLRKAKINTEMDIEQIGAYYIDVCDGDYLPNQKRIKDVQNLPLGYKQQSKIVEQYLSFPVKSDGNWGLVSLDEKILIPFEYDSLTMLTGVLVQLKKGNEITFFDLVSKQKLPFRCDSIFSLTIPIYSENSDYLIFRTNGKYGILNQMTKKYLPPIYDVIEQKFGIVEYGLASFFLEDGYFTPYSLEKGNLDVHNSDFLIRYKLDGKYGLINLQTLHDLTPKRYARIKIEANQNPLLTLDNKMTFVLADKQTIFNSLFDSITLLPTAIYNSRFDYTFFYRAKKNGLVGLFDENGNTILPMMYEDISNFIKEDIKNLNQFIVKKNGKYGVIDQNEKVLIPFKYDSILFNTNTNFAWQYELFLDEKSVFRRYMNL